MAKNNMHREPIPEEFETIEAAAEFWETHSLADYEDVQQEVRFEVELGAEKNYFAVEKELADSSAEFGASACSGVNVACSERRVCRA